MSTIEDDDYISKVNKYLAGSPTLSGGGPDPLKHVKYSFPKAPKVSWEQVRTRVQFLALFYYGRF